MTGKLGSCNEATPEPNSRLISTAKNEYQRSQGSRVRTMTNGEGSNILNTEIEEEERHQTLAERVANVFNE